MTCKSVNLRGLLVFAFCREGMRSVLGSDELEARTVGIGARKGRQISMELTVCQVVNDKAFISSEMRIGRSNPASSFIVWR